MPAPTQFRATSKKFGRTTPRTDILQKPLQHGRTGFESVPGQQRRIGACEGTQAAESSMENDGCVFRYNLCFTNLTTQAFPTSASNSRRAIGPYFSQ